MNALSRSLRLIDIRSRPPHVAKPGVRPCGKRFEARASGWRRRWRSSQSHFIATASFIAAITPT